MLTLVAMVLFGRFGATAQTAFITVKDACSSTSIGAPGWDVNVLAPGGGTYWSFPVQGSQTWSILGGDPTGAYTVTGAKPGFTVTGAGTLNNPGPNVNVNIRVTNPATPNFNINGIAARIGSAIQLYKCAGTTSVPLANTSTFQNQLTQYQVTVFNSNAAGNVLGQFSQIVWTNSFPGDIYSKLPVTASGQYFIVRLQVRNACGIYTTVKDALIRWNSNTLPAVNAFTLYSSGSNVPQATVCTSSPTLLCYSGGLGTSTTTGNNITQYRIRCYESTCAGAQTGVGVVLDATFSGNLPQNKAFTDMFLQQYGDYTHNYFANNLASSATKQWRMELTVFNDCGWSTAANSYFKISTFPGYMAPKKPSVLETEATPLAFLPKKVDETSSDGAITELSVFPNPVDNEAYFEFPTATGDVVNIQVFDMAGRLVQNLVNGYSFEAGNNHLVLNTADFAPGVYLYRADIGGKANVGRLVKQ